MINITITSDGTRLGTKLTVNGEAVSPESINFGTDSYDQNVWFSYTVKSKDTTNKLSTRTSHTFDPSLASMSKKTEQISEQEVDFEKFKHM